MKINKDLILRLDDDDLGKFLRWCLENDKDEMSGFALNDFNSRLYDKLYQSID